MNHSYILTSEKTKEEAKILLDAWQAVDFKAMKAASQSRVDHAIIASALAHISAAVAVRAIAIEGCIMALHKAATQWRSEGQPQIADALFCSIPDDLRPLTDVDTLTAAAALLRANGYVVEEPKCRTCHGERRVMSLFGDGGDIVRERCPTCSGSGARITQAQIDVIKELEAELDAHMNGTGEPGEAGTRGMTVTWREADE